MTDTLIERLRAHVAASAGVKLHQRNGVSFLTDETVLLLNEAAAEIASRISLEEHAAADHEAAYAGNAALVRLERAERVVAIARGGCHTGCSAKPYGHIDKCGLGQAIATYDAGTNAAIVPDKSDQHLAGLQANEEEK